MTPGSPVLIEPATWRDLNAVRRVEKACFPNDAWPLIEILGALCLSNIIRLKALSGGEVVGFIAGDRTSQYRPAWITTIGILPEYRRQGVGLTLLQAFEQLVAADAIQLSVRISNIPAQKLYRRAGYTDKMVKARYYDDGENALIMEKQITKVLEERKIWGL